MMLPTVVPLARLYAAATARLPRSAMVRLAFLAGYLGVWTVFAVAAMLGHRAVDGLVDAVRPGLVLGAVLVVAGLFQFSGLKHRCLTVCRSPWTFLWRYYARGIRWGWTLGARHGLFCLGCCWALMLVMVATGVASLPWMLALTGVLLVERTAPRGGRLVVPLGTALILAGTVVAAAGASAGEALVATAATLALAWWTRATVTRRRDRGRAAALGENRPQPVGAHTGCGTPSGRRPEPDDTRGSHESDR
jgi:predicted metal-binding membrane protein